jgi:DNA-binding MarR family transcriptional regulator
MPTESSSAPDERERRRLTSEVKRMLRDLTNEVALLNHQVSARVELRDIDLDCLDFVVQHGPVSPSELARRAGVHPATMTGILDRLERGGWISRDRDPGDRRAVAIRAERGRTAEIFGHYAGMNGSMDALCAGYDETQLTLLADFLRRAADAGRAATDELASGAGDAGQRR